MSVQVLDTRCANIASMLAALKRCGTEAGLCQDAAAIDSAPYVVLPGVGTFGAAMQRLAELQMIEALKKRIHRGAPTLCVCVGFQVLFERSEESPSSHGLGVHTGTVKRFASTVRVPQFGWNHIEPESCATLLQAGYSYFANSYYVSDAEKPSGACIARAQHGDSFIAAMESGAVLGCQFHPELSSDYGLSLLRRWLERGADHGAQADGARAC